MMPRVRTVRLLDALLGVDDVHGAGRVLQSTVLYTIGSVLLYG